MIDVGARPTSMRRVAATVLHLQKVANGVVHIALDVRAYGFKHVRMVLPGVKIIEGIGRRRWLGITVGKLPQMLPAAGLNQPVPP